MPILPISLPPGFYRNGTPYSRKNRVENGNLVRFVDGAYRPVGGWVRRTQTSDDAEIAALISDPDAEAIRDIFAWRDLDQLLNALFFSNTSVYHLDNVGVTTDVTPGGFTPINGGKDADTTSGYGIGPYGVGPYGVSYSLDGAEIVPPDRWYSDTFGEIALFGAINNGDLYEFDPNTMGVSTVANAPTENRDMCVTEQRQVFVVGANGEPRRVQASEVEDRTSWTAATDNQVIDRTLPGNGRLLRCVPTRNEVLILGEQDALAARYVGPPFVYNIDEVGQNCGPIAPQAVAKTSDFVVWWGRRNFWLYNGSLSPMECTVLDYLLDQRNEAQVSKIFAYTNTNFSEVTWQYQSKDSATDEVDSYVTWNYRTNTWTTGTLSRTAAIDREAFVNIIMVTPDGEIFNHELDEVFPLDEGDVFVETGPLDLQNGEKNMAVRYLYPDTENLGGVEYTLYGRQFPTATEYTYGPYTAANPTPTRAIGRSVRMRVDFSTGVSELGVTRFDVINSGTGQR